MHERPAVQHHTTFVLGRESMGSTRVSVNRFGKKSTPIPKKSPEFLTNEFLNALSRGAMDLRDQCTRKRPEKIFRPLVKSMLREDYGTWSR
jgi:hypothetical protein